VGHPGKPPKICPVVNVADLSDLLGQSSRENPCADIGVIKGVNPALVAEDICHLAQGLTKSHSKAMVIYCGIKQSEVCSAFITIQARMLKGINALK